MTLFTKPEKKFVVILGRIIDCNPFLPERVALEKQALGSTFLDRDANWNLEPTIYRRSENVVRIAEKAEALIASKKKARSSAHPWTEEEIQLFADLVDYVMFSRLAEDFSDFIDGAWSRVSKVYERFQIDLADVQPDQLRSHDNRSSSHLFAIYFQLYRAFRNIFDHLIGNSAPIIQLRAEVWRSIFSHDVRRYRAYLYEHMRDFSTLITGPSGSGKELVARAIGLSSYIPYSEERRRFELTPSNMFAPINLSAMSPTLIESELFGHKKGAYTGAVADRKGWLEACPEFGSVFLDEIGELEEGIQVKLLRVLQERTFQRLGETAEIPFLGKIIAATNHDVAAEMQSGGFREDFYYRLCSDRIHMPSLSQRCEANSKELQHLVEHLLRRVTPEHESKLTAELLDWIERNLGAHYDWPGNVRELEQCIRSWLIRKDYQPAGSIRNNSDQLKSLLRDATFTADELIAIYCAAKYEKLGSYQAVGKQLQLDRRTVKSRIDG